MGGGCEIEMNWEIIVEGEGEVFGKNEVKIGIMKGEGGKKRIISEVGKLKEMRIEMKGCMVKEEEEM